MSFRSIILGLCLLALGANVAGAHEHELGLSIEPALIAMPAIANQATHSTLAPAAGGGLCVEYYPLDLLAIVARGGYVEAFGDSLIGQAVFFQPRPR